PPWRHKSAIVVALSTGISLSWEVAQPPSPTRTPSRVTAATSPRWVPINKDKKSIKRRLGPGGLRIVHLSSFGFVVDGKRNVDQHGDGLAGRHVDGIERLAEPLLDPFPGFREALGRGPPQNKLVGVAGEGREGAIGVHLSAGLTHGDAVSGAFRAGHQARGQQKLTGSGFALARNTRQPVRR